jgi:phospholipid/cholesterol/gamma-HCH transport system substrate-binding protein
MSAIRNVTYNLREASENMKSTSLALDQILVKIERGQGTLGKLVHDPRLYDHIDSTAVNLNLLLKDIRENPSKYVQVSIF